MGPPLEERLLRATSDFVVRAFDALDPAVQEQFTSLRADPDFFGLLVPIDPRLPPKSLTRDAALFLLALATPQRVPTLIASIFGEDHAPLLALVADGVLEIEGNGSFVSGAAALDVLGRAERTRPPPRHPAHEVSAAAIAHVAGYEGLGATALAAKAYAFGRRPCTPALRRKLASTEDLLAFVGSAGGADVLARGRWRRSDDAASPWVAWSSGGDGPRRGYKLYVGAAVEAMPRVFAAAVRALDRVACDQFKLARNAETMCRPDKMMAYFGSLEEVCVCAALIDAAIVADGLPATAAQPVPFSAPADGQGFLSWGMDPPELAHMTGGLEQQSWRQWIAGRVGAAVASTKGPMPDVVAFVLDRLQLEGIDTVTWAPTLALWRDHAGNAGDVA